MQMHTPPTCKGDNMKETHLLQQKLHSTVLHSPLGKDTDWHYSSHHWGSYTLFGYWEYMKEWKVQNERMNIGGFTRLTSARTYIYTVLQNSTVCEYVCRRCAWRCTELLTKIIVVLTKCSPKPRWTAAARIARAVEPSIETEAHILACMQECAAHTKWPFKVT